MSLLKKLRKRILLPILHFTYILKSKNVTFADKAKICGAIIYAIVPTDLIPDFIPVAGYGDDLAGLIWAIFTIRKNITPEIKEKAENRLNKWFENK